MPWFRRFGALIGVCLFLGLTPTYAQWVSGGGGSGGGMATDASNAVQPTTLSNLGAAPGDGVNVVKGYGADPTGATDSAAAIQAAVDAAAGREVFFPAGQYKMCSAVTSSTPVHIAGIGTGSGPGAASQSNSNVSQILLCGATQSGFVITSIYPSHFHDFQMNVAVAARPQTAGVGIELIGTGTTNQANSVIERVGFTNVFNPIHILRPAWPLIHHNYFDSWGAAGEAVKCDTSAAVEGACGEIAHNYFFGSGTRGPAVYSEVGYTEIHDNEILGGTISLNFPINNNPAGFIKIHDNTIENSLNNAISVSSQDGSAVGMVMVQNNEFSNVSFATALTQSMVVKEYLVGGVGQKYIDNVLVQGNVFRNSMAANTKYVWVQAGSKVDISRNLISELGANNPIGIQVSGSTSNAGLDLPITIQDNQITGTTNRYSLQTTVKPVVRDSTGMTTAALAITGIGEGSQIFATDADPGSSPCTHSGAQTGAMAFYQSGAWSCGNSGGSVSVTAGTPNVVITPSPGTGTFTVGLTNAQNSPADGGSHSYTLLAGDAAKEVVLAATFTSLAVPQATGSFAAGYSATVCALGPITVTSTTSTINAIAGATGIKIGANQCFALDSISGNWIATSGLPQAATQTASTVLLDDNTYGKVALANLATQATNTVVGNATSGTATPTALAVGSCSTGGSALIWTTNTGFGCNTAIAASTVTTNANLTGNVTSVGNATTIAANVLATALTYVIDGGGSAITTGVKGDLLIPFACTINSATLQADQSGSIVVDIWKKAYATSSPPTVANTITASALPTLASAQSSQDTTLTGWSTGVNVSANDMLRFNVNSATTVTRVTLTLKCTKT